MAAAACYGTRSSWSVAADMGSEAPGICWIDVPGFWSALRACCCGVSGGVLRSFQLWPGVQLPPKGGSLLAMLSAVSPSIVYFFYS